MVMCCAASGCRNRHNSQKKVSFHKFPLKNPSLLKMWMVGVRRPNFIPSKHSVLCGEHFTPDSFYPSVTGYRQLRETAFPTIFHYPTTIPKRLVKLVRLPEPAEPMVMCQVPTSCPAQPTCTSPPSCSVLPTLSGQYSNMPAEHNYYDNTTTSLHFRIKYESLEAKNKELSTKLKKYLSHLSRRDAKITRLESTIKVLKSERIKYLTERADIEILKEFFTGESLMLNKMQKKSGGPNNPKKAEYSADLRNFALTLHGHSPEAYRFMRKSFCLPSESCLRKWKTSTKDEAELNDALASVEQAELEEEEEQIEQEEEQIQQDEGQIEQDEGHVPEKRPPETMDFEEESKIVQVNVKESRDIDEKTEEGHQVITEESPFFYLLLEQISTQLETTGT